MIFRQLYDAPSSTYTYLLGDETSGRAVLIDPVFEQHARDAALIRELGLGLDRVLDTHVHADHVTGAWLMREAFGARIGVSRHSGAENADDPIADGDEISVGQRSLTAMATPGHTAGCLTFALDDRSMAFTGDALLIRGAGRTDFQGGDAHTLYRSITGRIFTLPDACLLYPAHDYEGRTVTSVLEERAFNARVGGEADENDFVRFMESLGLPHPKKIDVAVPANLVCGRPPDGVTPARASWGPVVRTYAGIPEIDPKWVAAHRAEVRVVDVRDPEELASADLGPIDGAIHIPLDQLRARTAEVPADVPVVTVCRSGRRSAQAALILERAGIDHVANLAGGMLSWHHLGLSSRQGV